MMTRSPWFLVVVFFIAEHACNDEFCIPGEDDDCPPTPTTSDGRMHLSVVACGDRLEEALTMIKTALMFAGHDVHVHVFADDHLQEAFRVALQVYTEQVKWKRFTYDIRRIQFPAPYAEKWRALFKTCASLRLFLPDLLPLVDRVIYVDTDTIFLKPIDDLWAVFDTFNETNVAAMAWEHEKAGDSWYSRHARHPYYAPGGVNSGVMLMELSRMRERDWSSLMRPIYETYKSNMTWGDQDILNILFHERRDWLTTFGCEWNYRPDYCMYVPHCQEANENGAFIVHGSRSYFHIDKQPMWREFYSVVRDYELGTNKIVNLVKPIQMAFQELSVKRFACDRNRQVFYKSLEQLSTRKSGD